MDKNITEYIDKQPSPQKEICTKLRKLILKHYPDIDERMKLGVPMYGEKFYIVSLKDHVNLGFNLKGMTKDEISLFEGGGKEYKIKEFRSVKEIDEKEVVKLMKMVKTK